MTTVIAAAALISVALNAFAAALGTWHHRRGAATRATWAALRAGQLAAAVVAVLAGVAVATGEPFDDLFYLYALLPVAVSLIAEQLRIATAQAVLDARGLDGAAAVGELPEHEQRAIVAAVLARELLALTVAAGVIAFLELRAATTAGL